MKHIGFPNIELTRVLVGCAATFEDIDISNFKDPYSAEYNSIPPRMELEA